MAALVDRHVGKKVITRPDGAVIFQARVVQYVHGHGDDITEREREDARPTVLKVKDK